MRKVFIILGAVLGIVVAAGIFMFLQLTRPTIVEVPVATTDIPAGTVLRPALFRVARMADVDAQTLSKWVTLQNWNQAEGKVATAAIRAGFPVAKAQIDPNSSSAIETRLALALTRTTDYYVVIPTKPDVAGNYMQPGDRIDLIVSLGDAGRKDELELPITNTNEMQNETEVAYTMEMTQNTPMPISKLIMQDMTVLRVDRAAARTTSQSSTQQTQQQEQPLATGDVQRIYVKVDRDQLEVLSFVLNNGKHNMAIRAANGSHESPPTDGVTWNDFVRWFYAQRGNNADGAQPFTVISKYEPRQVAK